MKKIDFVDGSDFHQLLEEAGIIPPNTGDLIIEVPSMGPVIIHSISLAPRNLLKVFRAHVSPARLSQKKRRTDDTASRQSTTESPERIRDLQVEPKGSL